MKTNNMINLKSRLLSGATILSLMSSPAVFAASQSWVAEPADAQWVNGANWSGGAAPGGINMTGNTVNNDTATFSNAIPGSLIGSATIPILVDDATTDGNRSRQLGSILFTGNAGAYVFSSASPTVVPSTGILYLSHNGSITMTAEVTNSQRFEVPIYTRLPSSTAGIYSFINNATDPNATLYIASAINDSANTRGTDFQLNGSNTGANTVAYISAGTTTSGANGLTKLGTGTWILSGANDFRSQTAVNILEGTLIVKDAAAFNGANTATISNAVLQLDEVTLNQFNLNLRHNGTIRMNGVAGVNGLIIGNHPGTVATLATMSATDFFTVGGVSTVSGGADDTVLQTTGPGTVVLASPNTYIGNWNFMAATNQLFDPSSLGTGENVNIGAGAIFDFTAYGAAPFTPPTEGFGGSGTGTTLGVNAAAVIGDAGSSLDLTGKNINLTFAPANTSGDLTHPALYVAQGTLSIGGNTFFINNASGSPLGVGTYRLIQQATGNIASAGGYAALVSGSGLVPGAAAAIQVSGGNVDMVVTIYIPKNLVWSGSASTWDLGNTVAWLDGATPSVFNNSDDVTFNSVGVANSDVSLSGTLAPAAVTVDTSGGDYSFGGAGQIAGTTELKKVGAGVLTVSTANTYAGGTVVSNGTLRIAQANAIPSVGAGNVGVHGSGVIDLNGFNNVINGLTGNGTVDVQTAGESTLTVGNNNASSSFSGTLTDTVGTLHLTKIGNGTLTLEGAHSYSGNTTINGGTLLVNNPNAIGSGNSPLAMNGGALRTTTSLSLTNLTGAVGSSLANAEGATATLITHRGTGNYTGVISDGASGTLGVYVASGALRLNAANTYSGGTIVASGATLEIGVINPGGSGNAGSGGIVASNGAVISLPTAVSTAASPNNAITNIDANGTIILSSASQGNSFNGLFIGGPNNTNIFVGPGSIGGAETFAQFSGTVIFTNGSSWRWFNANGGGESTTFVINEGANLFSRDASTIRLGALRGSGNIGNPSVSAPATYLIGAKDLTTTFAGGINGSNNIVKVGAGGLTLNGVRYYTNAVTLPDFNVVEYTVFSNAIAYIGNTVVSNGTLTIVAPNNLTNSPNITLAGGTLDVTQIGYVTNQTMLDVNSEPQATNSVIVTTGTLEILDAQSLNGNGNITGDVVTAPGSTITVGQPIGTLAVSGSIALNGTVNMDLDRSNSQKSDRITAAIRTGSGATLNVTNLGPNLATGDVFQLFNGPVTAFTTVNLPVATEDNSITYVWENNLAVDGTIKVLSGASPVDPTPTDITTTVVGNTLHLAWPSSHTGWTLQVQTNALNVGLSDTWVDVAGSANTNEVFIQIDPANPSVFYRLRLVQP